MKTAYIATEIEDEPFTCSKARETLYSHAEMCADTGAVLAKDPKTAAPN
jgi:hypothetical protein